MSLGLKAPRLAGGQARPLQLIGALPLASGAPVARRGQALRKEEVMLWTIAVILAVLWLLGMVSSYTMGGFVHLLLLLAVVVVLINLIQGRRIA
jgi:Family of unknown function (DUF5670)